MSGSGETYCLCGQPYAPGQFMIECDCCREWFHGGCVNVKIFQSEDIDKYHCPKCTPTYGPSIYKVPTNIHRQDRYELNADRKPTQTGSGAFVTNLAARVFPTSHVLRMDGRNFTEAYIKEKGFHQPILFETIAGLDLKVPPANTFTVRTVERHCGSDREVDVIDVTRQTNFKMALGDFVDYFTESNRTKVLNVLSLEFSDTSMSGLVQSPLLARQLDWVRLVWPSNIQQPFSPLVQKYCIMSAAASYTDFHIDFGGTTVWYHILHGKKIFYMIPPTPTNLALYQEWSTSAKQNEVFFGDLVDSCSTCILRRGQTLFIPTGWIHAVLTPEDSLVFGGNFLHSYNIELQLQINEIEKQVETPSMFRFPLFETIHWYAGSYLLQQLKRINEEQQDEDFTLEEHHDGFSKRSQILLEFPSCLIKGIRVLITTLKEWHACKSYDPNRKQSIPDTINSGQLVRDLSRELRKLEKILIPSQYISNSSNKKKKKRLQQMSVSLPSIIDSTHYFSNISKEQMNADNISDPTFDFTNLRYNVHSNQSNKKSLKLTLPKPIMHVPDSQNIFSNSSQDSEDGELNSMASMASKSGIISYNHNYDSQDSFSPESDYKIPNENIDCDNKLEKCSPPSEKNSNNRSSAVLKIKLGSSPHAVFDNNVRSDISGYTTSILKSHLVNNLNNNHRKTSNQWTISKSQVKSNTTGTTDEQVLFTNENLTLPSTSNVNPSSFISTNVSLNTNIYGSGIYTSEGNDHINQMSIDNYNPDFIIDRKNSGLGLPDYSPTKSINEYLGSTKLTFVDQSKVVIGDLANNSDPYSQSFRNSDNTNALISDPTIKSNPEYYKFIHGNLQNCVVSSKRFVRNDCLNNAEINFKKNQDLSFIDDISADLKRNKILNVCTSLSKANMSSTDDHIHSNANVVNPHVIIENVNSVASSNENMPLRRTDRPIRRRVDPRSSLYDYEDQDEIDERDLYVDESPKPVKPRRRTTDKNSKTRNSQACTRDATSNVKDLHFPEGFVIPKNGIESLLQASAYTGSPGTDIQESDAVAGMLSIGQSYGLAKSETSRNVPSFDTSAIKAVHNDEEFVYPSLEMSSDDDDDISTKKRSRAKRRRNLYMTSTGDKSDREDESWWPRARLGRLVPRVNRPSRRSSGRECVQAVLRAARLRGVSNLPNNPSDSNHSLFLNNASSIDRSSPDSKQDEVIDSLPSREPTSFSNMKKLYKKKRSLKALRPIPMQHVLSSSSGMKSPKFKKGMKTVKQRLGKILKINKMVY